MKFEITVFGVVLPSPNEWRVVAIAKSTKRAEEPTHNPNHSSSSPSHSQGEILLSSPVVALIQALIFIGVLNQVDFITKTEEDKLSSKLKK
ncbi:hypothetical protein L2E82_06201 [Cichorium intybus]|uniref:Uncharacterized protein n=1 Tax=Cichorium intybus TaxID=13427 RepID=A0ACB9HAQ0_CICIN|nr:hypothetical protein L2E82_06201 [Cichorium intybus]